MAEQPLTYETAVAMIEQLKGITLLTDWLEDSEYIRERRLHGSQVYGVLVYVAERGPGWCVMFNNDVSKAIYLERFETADDAKRFVDAILAQTPGVLAAGISPVQSKESEA